MKTNKSDAMPWYLSLCLSGEGVTQSVLVLFKKAGAALDTNRHRFCLVPGTGISTDTVDDIVNDGCG